MNKTMQHLLIALMVFSAATLNAAPPKKSSVTTDKLPARYHLGVRLGMSVNTMVYTNRLTNRLAMVQGGLAFDYRLSRTLPIYLETGLYYMDKGLNYTSYDEVTYHDHAIYAPVLACYHIRVSRDMYVQPFFGFTFGGLTKTSEFESTYRIGAGFNYKQYYANLGVDIGLARHLRQYTNNTFFFTFGFNFLGKK